MTFSEFINAGYPMPDAFAIVPPFRDGGPKAAELFRMRYDERRIYTDNPAKFDDMFVYYSEILCPIYAERITAAKSVLTQFLEDSDTVATTTTGTENLRAAPNGTVAPAYSLGGTDRGSTTTVTKSGGSSGDPARLAAINDEIRNLYDEFFRKFEPLFPEVW